MTIHPEQRFHERREAIVLEHVAAENRHDAEATIATFHSARYEVDGEESDGEAAVRDLLQELMAGFPDFKAELGKIYHADDAVIGDGRVTGTHTGDFAGVPATGRPVDYPLVAIFEFDGPPPLRDGLLRFRHDPASDRRAPRRAYGVGAAS